MRPFVTVTGQAVDDVKNSAARELGKKRISEQKHSEIRRLADLLDQTVAEAMKEGVTPEPVKQAVKPRKKRSHRLHQEREAVFN